MQDARQYFDKIIAPKSADKLSGAGKVFDRTGELIKAANELRGHGTLLRSFKPMGSDENSLR
jgi:hypothetical protein